MITQSIRLTLSGAAVVLVTATAVAQNAQTASNTRTGGRPITPADIRTWNAIRQNSLSSDGKWFAYVFGNSESNDTLILRGTARESAERMRVSVGAGGGSVQISGDSKWIGYLGAPPRAAPGGGGGGGARGGGRGGAQGGRGGQRGGDGGQGGAPGAGAQQADSAATPQSYKFVLMNLATGEKKEFEQIRRFSFNSDKPTWVVMQAAGGGGGGRGAGAAGGGRGGRGGRGDAGGGTGGAQSGGDADLLLYNLETGGPRLNIGLVYQYAFNESGEWLAYTMDNENQIGNAVQLRNMNTGAIVPLESEQVLYRHLAWVDSSRAVAVMKGRVLASGTRDTVFSLEVFRGIGANGAKSSAAFNPEGRRDFPAGWKLASDRAPRYSADMSQVFFGIREALRASDRGLAAGRGSPLIQPGAPGAGGTINQTAAGRGASGNAASDSVPSLILWHAKDPRLQSQQIVQEAQDRAFNYLVSYRFDRDRFVQLTDSTLRQVNVVANDRFAYGSDNRAYQQQASYSGRNYADYYIVDLQTGARKLLWKKRLNGNLQVSPDGKKALFWGSDGHYWVLDLASYDSVNITRSVPTSFVNSEDDHNWLVPPPIGSRGWSKDGQYVLLYDNWDIWKVPVNPRAGAAVNLTGDGRKNQVRYRTIYSFTDEDDTPEDDSGPPGGGGRGGRGGGGAVDLSKPLYIGTYGEWTKKEGISRVEPEKPGAKSLFFEDARISITKARSAPVYAFTRQTFTEYPNWWIFNPEFQGGFQITDVNPQVKDLAMSSGTRLIDYKSDKGDKLQGALYLPANYEPGKKYPLLVTIYEKRSQNKNGFVNPSETQTPNARMYTSRGYAVLDPDIVYRVNDPGMSAVWCVVPAVKAAIATGIVDPARVGLWGHSWGGYQTAFLVTQTNIFRAAVAGAALTDMVSMYNSIYWNTGGTNQAIFEASQGRFKGNVADNYDAYIRNSPVFHAQNVKTPLMLLHNDKDGAVDFNQGITYFNALRQLGKDVIMLEYVGENHGVSRPVNQRDYAQRMGEWFDHFLMDKPAPDWMKNGVPRIQMAEHLASRMDSSSVRVILP